jgi:hypothetical protein
MPTAPAVQGSKQPRDLGSKGDTNALAFPNVISLAGFSPPTIEELVPSLGPLRRELWLYIRARDAW